MMSRFTKITIVLLRVTIGWFFLDQGIIAILNKSWSVTSYVQNSSIIPAFYKIVLASNTHVYFDYLLKGLFIIAGLALILGVFARAGALIGILISLFLYLPLLKFPFVATALGGSFYVVDSHLITITALIFLYAVRSGEFFGLGSRFRLSKY